jgi:uncharacterized protein YggE
MEITKTVTLNESIESDFYKIHIVISKKDKNKGDIEITFEKAIDYAKDTKVCKGGKYNIYPMYSYTNNKRIFDSYNGNISFDCTFKDEKIIEEFLTDLNRLRDIEVSQGEINPTLSDKQVKELEERLEKKVYSYAKEYSSFVTEEADSKCETSKIEFLSYNNVMPMARMTSADKTSSNITKPIDNIGNKTLRVKYTFSCED